MLDLVQELHQMLRKQILVVEEADLDILLGFLEVMVDPVLSSFVILHNI